jgi:uncharacterized protein (DUF2141 family)
MLKYLISLSSLSIAIVSSTAFSQSIEANELAVTAQTVNLTVELQNVDSSLGTVDLAIYNNSTGFPGGGTPFQLAQAPAQKGTVKVQVPNLPDGVYAITVLHDDNGDGKMDYNGLGMPTKGFGFSNNPNITFGAPSFDDCKITVTQQSNNTVIVMKHY